MIRRKTFTVLTIRSDFYGYDNTDVDRQTSMKITYKVDGAVMDRTYPIKTKPGDAVKVVAGESL